MYEQKFNLVEKKSWLWKHSTKIPPETKLRKNFPVGLSPTWIAQCTVHMYFGVQFTCTLYNTYCKPTFTSTYCSFTLTLQLVIITATIPSKRVLSAPFLHKIYFANFREGDPFIFFSSKFKFILKRV